MLDVVTMITSGNKYTHISMPSEQYKPNTESGIFEMPNWIIGSSHLVIQCAQVYLPESADNIIFT